MHRNLFVKDVTGSALFNNVQCGICSQMFIRILRSFLDAHCDIIYQIIKYYIGIPSLCNSGAIDLNVIVCSQICRTYSSN
jgi:hypothetical protein